MPRLIMGKRWGSQFPIESRIAGEDLISKRTLYLERIWGSVHTAQDHHKPLREAITGTGKYLRPKSEDIELYRLYIVLSQKIYCAHFKYV